MQTPQSNKTRITTVLNAWRHLRPGKRFSGMTLEEYENTVRASLEWRAKIERLEAELLAARAERDDADRISMAATRRVVDGVIADPKEGSDGALYSAMGFVRKSENRRGLVRRVGRRGTTPTGKRK